MAGADEAQYRLRLAAGFLEEARDDGSRGRWRSCVDNCQLAVENAAKAYLALLGPLGRTHNPGGLLRMALERRVVPGAARTDVGRLADASELLGQDIHAQSDHGDEVGRRTPWELFDEAAAREALTEAETAVAIADRLVRAPGDGPGIAVSEGNTGR